MFNLRWIASCLLAVWTLSGCASKPPKTTGPEAVMPAKSILNEGVAAKIVKYGTYTTRGPQLKRFDPNIPNQTSTFSMETTFQKQTDRIPGRIGSKFGVWFEISGLPPQSIAELQIVVIHPPIKGADGNVTTRSFWRTVALVNQEGIGRGSAGYLVEEPYEIAEGDWTFEIKRVGDVLARQKFHMYRSRK